MFSRLTQLSRHLPRASSTPGVALTSPLRLSPRFTSVMGSALPPHPNQRSQIHTAGCIIIGDEVLGGKTVDTNSAWFAKYCFDLGIQLKRVEVIPDDEEDIVEAVRRMSKNYDFVVTSGGIGPTHDDITYASIAKAFGTKLVLHEKSYERMRKLSKNHKSQPNFTWDKPSPELTAKLRMVQLPWDESLSEDSQVWYGPDDMWVPISINGGNVYIFPGIPRLFTALLDSIKPRIKEKVANEGKGSYRILFSTPLAESSAASYLTELSEKVKAKNVKVGSYPRWGKKTNVVTLVGTDREYMESLVPEVEKAVQGRRVQVEGEDDSDVEEAPKKDSEIAV